MKSKGMDEVPETLWPEFLKGIMKSAVENWERDGEIIPVLLGDTGGKRMIIADLSSFMKSDRTKDCIPQIAAAMIQFGNASKLALVSEAWIVEAKDLPPGKAKELKKLNPNEIRRQVLGDVQPCEHPDRCEAITIMYEEKDGTVLLARRLILRDPDKLDPKGWEVVCRRRGGSFTGRFTGFFDRIAGPQKN